MTENFKVEVTKNIDNVVNFFFILRKAAQTSIYNWSHFVLLDTDTDTSTNRLSGEYVTTQSAQFCNTSKCVF